MTLLQQIEALEAMPLLGSSRHRALEIAQQLTLRLDPEQRPDLVLRIIIVRFLALPTSTDTLAQLSTAEAWAEREELTDIATRLQLLWCASVARTHPEAVREDVLNQALEAVGEFPGLMVEKLLTMAACEAEHADTHLRAALSLMNSPRFASQRLRAWLDLSSALRLGADMQGAKDALESAMALAREFGDRPRQIEVLMRLGLHYLDRGMTDKAEGLLEESLSLSRREEDDLSTVVTASILSAIYLDRDHREKAAKSADVLLVAGARRANWFAVIDGHITRSTLLLLDGDLQGAINRLVRAAVHLRELVPAAAINLLKGRLAELRFTIGTEEFDLHYRIAMAEHKPH